MTPRSYIAAIAAAALVCGTLHAQILLKDRSFDPASAASVNGASSQLNSNSVTDMIINGSTIWLGTGKGLSRSTDGGATWTQYYNTAEFGTEDISAIAVHNNEVWVATAHSEEHDNQNLPVGSGLHYSTDGGETWRHIPQPVDVHDVDTLYYNAYSTIRAIGVTTPIQNITYDIAVTDSAVWICSFAGMARKSTDKGATWQRVILPPDGLDRIRLTDTLHFDLSPSMGKLGLTQSYNHRAFSVMAENDSTIWIGSAGGINKSTDGGRQWVKYDHLNETSPISGNFIVAIAKQPATGMIWAGSVNAEGADEKRGVSFTADEGATWKTALLGEFVHAVGFNGTIAYAATDDGIFRSADLGATWSATGTIYDPVSKQRMVTPQFYATASQGTTAWFGGSEGIARTLDDGTTPFGSSWSILRAAQPLPSTASTYAYPNPFSPDDEAVRIHYSSAGTGSSFTNSSSAVSIRIFDFGMHLVRTLIQNAPRLGSREFDEIWDGKDDNRNQVANGVYFYQVIVDNSDPVWGKILVLQ